MELENFVLWEVRQAQKDKDTLISHVESKKVKLLEVNSRMVTTSGQGRGMEKKRKILMKRYKLSVRQEVQGLGIYCTKW